MKRTWISVIVLVFFSALENGFVSFVVKSATDAAIDGWTEPTISGANGQGTLTIPENQALNAMIVTYVATTDATSIASYSLVTSVTPFALSATGELTITAALDFEIETSYTVHVKAEDNAGGVGTATITVTITDVAEPAPVFSSTYTPCILDGSTEDTTLTTVKADSLNTLQYAITSAVFKIDVTSGLIQVATGITLDKNTQETYELEVTATDNATPQLTGTTTVSATVKDVCDNGSSSVTFSVFMLLLSFLVANM